MLTTALQNDPVLQQPRPTQVTVVYDSNPLEKGWAVARLESGEHTEVAFRWNEGGLPTGTALQQGRNPNSWIVLPDELASGVLEAAERLRAAAEEEIFRGYQEMAADEEREREAMEWSEALIGDGLEAR